MIPINPGYTPDELRYWLTDGDAEHLLIADTCLGVYRAMQAQSPGLAEHRVVTYGAAKVEGLPWWRELLAQASQAFTAAEPVELDDIVNIQYTSGSTGWPKGCLLSHRYWLQFGKASSEAWPTFNRNPVRSAILLHGPAVAVHASGIPGRGAVRPAELQPSALPRAHAGLWLRYGLDDQPRGHAVARSDRARQQVEDDRHLRPQQGPSREPSRSVTTRRCESRLA